MKNILLLLAVLALAACATKRYGRVQGLSELEKDKYQCEDIGLELAKIDEFEKQIKEGAEFSTASVFGILGDFGIGNKMEKDSAMKSARLRRSELQSLAREKGCKDLIAPSVTAD